MSKGTVLELISLNHYVEGLQLAVKISSLRLSTFVANELLKTNWLIYLILTQ